MEDLLWLIRKAKRYVLNYLKDNGSSKRLELEKYVMDILNLRELKDGTIVHRNKPIHGLAFIIAYKELEFENQIRIQRSATVPFPMTASETLFSLKRE